MTVACSSNLVPRRLGFVGRFPGAKALRTGGVILQATKRGTLKIFPPGIVNNLTSRGATLAKTCTLLDADGRMHSLVESHKVKRTIWRFAKIDRPFRWSRYIPCKWH